MTSSSSTSYRRRLPATQGRNWSFTLTNPDSNHASTLLSSLGVVRYAVYQIERGPDAGVLPCAVGYVEFKTVKTLASVKGLLPRAHWDVRRGTREQAQQYCMNEATRAPGEGNGPFIVGEFVPSGSRNDLRARKRFLDDDADGSSDLPADRFTLFARHEASIRAYIEERSGEVQCPDCHSVFTTPSHALKYAAAQPFSGQQQQQQQVSSGDLVTAAT